MGGGPTGRCVDGGCQGGTREGGRQRGLEWKDRQGEEVALHVLYGLGDTLAGAQRGIRRLRQGQGPRQPCPHRAGLMMCGKRWGLGLEKALVWLAHRPAAGWPVGGGVTGGKAWYSRFGGLSIASAYCRGVAEAST